MNRIRRVGDVGVSSWQMPTHGAHLFSFAVISDSHVNEDEDRSTSPYASNKLANGRFRWVVQALNRQRPAFTLHLGDMANPLPELASCARAVASFKSIAGELESPLHLAAGNHCVGDKPTGWVPVPRISEESFGQWEGWFGRPFYSFDHGPCHFAVLSSLLVNSGTEREREQQRWLEDDLALAASEGKRLFAAMHYPLYVASPAEPGSYDNVDEPGRSRLLTVLERNRVEAVFSGHVHNFFYNRSGPVEMYTVPATSFVRQDYGELYSVAPGDDEGGRGDAAKLGYFLVEVYERGHAVRLVRTYGRTLGAGERLATPEPIPIRPRVGPPAPLGVEMRENWMSRVALPTNNSVSPFTRRWARNDWPVAALAEMGVMRLRLFLHELAKDDVVERMADLKAAGCELLAYSYGFPDDWEVRLIRDHHELLSGWELIAGVDPIGTLARGMEKLALELPDRSGLPCYLSEVRDVVRGQIDDANVKHVANYGFQLAERAHVEELLRSAAIAATFRGLVFRLRRRGEPQLDVWPSIREIGEIGAANGMRHQVHVLFSGNVTAERFVDDLKTANRVAEAAFAAAVAGNVDVWLDTFEDSDRGYFVRHGLVDRRYDPRLAARVLGHLNAVLAGHDFAGVRESVVEEIVGGRAIRVRLGSRWLRLVLPYVPLELREIGTAEANRASSLSVLDLASGVGSGVRVRTEGGQLVFEEPRALRGPHWIEEELS
jgi:3',5'-cyclic AMP phosphodiesterase CpdA